MKDVKNFIVGGYTDRIQNLSIRINDQISELDSKLDTILEKHEKDFLTAYRVRFSTPNHD